jgi:hypothetical protein
MIWDQEIHMVVKYFGFEFKKIQEKEKILFSTGDLPLIRVYENGYGCSIECIPTSLSRSNCVIYHQGNKKYGKKIADVAELFNELNNIPLFLKIR